MGQLQIQEDSKIHKYNNKFTLKTNTKKHHKIPFTDNFYQCSTCNKTCPSKIALMMHRRLHSEMNYQEYNIHPKPLKYTGTRQKVAEDLSPYTCNQCYKSFARKGSLAIHMKIHTEVKFYQCSKCAQSFLDMSDLLKHQKSHIVNKNFECKKCGKYFSQKYNLKSHMILHTEQKPHVCSHCGIKFARMNDLIKHKRKVLSVMSGVFSK